MRKWFELLLVSTLVASGSVASGAEIVVGTVVAARGAVYTDAATGQQALMVNAPVHRDEMIVTRAGKAKIALNDGTIISIGENSRMHVAHYIGMAPRANVSVNLVSGVLRLFVVRATSTGTFEVETQTAIAAVRGTDWVIEATSERTSVAVIRGAVAVSGRADPQATVVLGSPGQGTDVPRGGAPTPAAPWGIKRLADVLARATFD